MWRSSSVLITQKDLSSSRSAGWSNERSHGSGDAGVSPKIGRISTERRSHFCASLQSGSCSENYVIPHDLSGQTLTQIKAPIFLAFGAKEPFIPGTALNGLKDLAGGVIVPFVERMAAAGNRPTVKIYPDTGHFIHTDNPVQFASDVIDFVELGNVVPNSPVAFDRLVNGTSNEETVGVAPTPPGASPTAGLNK